MEFFAYDTTFFSLPTERTCTAVCVRVQYLDIHTQLVQVLASNQQYPQQHPHSALGNVITSIGRLLSLTSHDRVMWTNLSFLWKRHQPRLEALGGTTEK